MIICCKIPFNFGFV